MHCRALRRDGSRKEVVEDPRRRGGKSQCRRRGEDVPVVDGLCLLSRCLVSRRSIRAVTGFSNKQRTGSRNRLDPAQHGAGIPCRTVVVVVPEVRRRTLELMGEQGEQPRRHARGRHRPRCSGHGGGQVPKHPGHPGHCLTISRVDFILQLDDSDMRIVSVP